MPPLSTFNDFVNMTSPPAVRVKYYKTTTTKYQRKSLVAKVHLLNVFTFSFRKTSISWISIIVLPYMASWRIRRSTAYHGSAFRLVFCQPVSRRRAARWPAHWPFLETEGAAGVSRSGWVGLGTDFYSIPPERTGTFLEYFLCDWRLSHRTHLKNT